MLFAQPFYGYSYDSAKVSYDPMRQDLHHFCAFYTGEKVDRVLRLVFTLPITAVCYSDENSSQDLLN